MLKCKKYEKGIALIYLILIIIAIVIVAVATFFVVNHSIKSKNNNEISNQAENNIKKENEVEGTNVTEIAYEFSTDSKNKKVYKVTTIEGTDLYKVTLYGKNNNAYVMDENGNTIFKILNEVEITSDYKYIYTYSGSKIHVYDVDTHREVTPEGINNNFSSGMFFIEGDIIFTYKASYDLLTGKCLWTGEKITEIQKIIYKANGLMLCLDYDDNYVVYNYLTGKNLCEGLQETYTGCQINSAGCYIIQVGNVVKTYDLNGQYLNEFNIPAKHKMSEYIMPGKYFGFYEDKKNPYQVTITDISGNIIREDVYIRDWSDTYYYYPQKDTIMVHGDLTGYNREWYSGILDSSMNWVISQTDKLYTDIKWLHKDIYSVEENNDDYYIYNSATGAKVNAETSAYLKYYIDANKLIKINNKMYKIDTLELINIEYKENCKYYQLSENTFLEYNKDNAQQNIYDENGKIITTVKIDEGIEYKGSQGNSILTYNRNTGYSLIEIDI